MKISKVNTSSFAISKDLEAAVRENAENESKGGVNKISLEGKYAPMAKFRALRREAVTSGSIKFLAMKKTIYADNTSHFYVNLASGRLVYVSGKGRRGVELSEFEFFEKLLDMPSKVINMLGYLTEHGSTKKEELESDTLDELIMHGLAEEYLYERNIFLEYIFREVGDFVGPIPEGTRNMIRPTYVIPRFGNPKYNLGNFLEVDDTIETSYPKDSIKYSDEQVKGVLGTLFRAKVDLIEVTYMPYYQYNILKSGMSERETHILACLKGRAKLAYPHPFKLKPLSLYSMEAGAKLVPIEGDVITFEDIGNLKNAKEEIMRKIVYPFKSAAAAGKTFSQTLGGILFYGPPGCGKTYLAKATVGEVGVSFITGNIEDIMSEGVDMAAKKLHDVFDYARSAAPCVLFFDEIDAIASRRDLHGPTALVNQLLTEMDGIVGLGKNVLIIGATNMPWRLDTALLRGGRFTEQVYIKSPDFESRAEMFDIYLKKLEDLSPGVSARELASLTEYYSAADIKTIVDRAATFALESSIKTSGRRHRIQQWHLIQAIKERKPSLIPWFKYAEKQMEIEGAKEAYPELWDDIQKFNINVQKIRAGEGEANELTKMIEDWKKEEKTQV
ncbi:MAG: ATP-binding protein [Candidatus Altiarchaeota archaeon]